MKTSYTQFLTLSLIALLLFSCNSKDKQYSDDIYQKPDIVKSPSSKFLSPEESIKTMHLPDGYRVELVASEPMINEPVTMAWAPDGKLYVAEMLTYMQTIDAKDQDQPWSRISVLEDTNNDGKMDKSTVFIDSLLLPRTITTLDDRIIVRETYKQDMWSYRDTNGDNVADEKILLKKFHKRNNSNLEHQPASLMWSIDNHMYLSNTSLRYKFTHNKIEIDTLSDAPSGQWGLTEDEIGQLYYSSAGGEVPALGFQQHPSYGCLELPGNWEKDFEKVWPIIQTPDVQGGLKRLREDGTLNHFTASCGQSIFLGDKLPFYGDLFIPEPVGRLIRRAKVNRIDGKTVLSNAYKETEFLASTDMNFRPVETKTGPDGCLYIVDMYRGIIQEGNWVRKGSFLRPVVEANKFDKNIGKGRIYRIVKDDTKPSKVDNLLAKTSKELLSYLGHPNGWHRINAQKLIILKKDKSIITDLKKITLNNNSPLARLHALWTLEGLDAVTPKLVIEKFKDEDARLKQAALRISERYLKAKNNHVYDALEILRNDPSKDVIVQLMLTLRTRNSRFAKRFIKELMEKNPYNEAIKVVGEEGIKVDPPIVEQLKKQYRLASTLVRSNIIEGYEHFKTICAACHGIDGKGVKDLAPPLVGSPRLKGSQEVSIKILLNGLTGPVDNKEYGGVMVGMKNQDDQWISSVLTYVRLHLNKSKPIGYWQVEGTRKKFKNREDFWTIEELEKKHPKNKNKKH